MIEAGRLRHKVAIQERVEVQDTHGDMVVTWCPVAKVWAAIEPLSGREFIAAAATQSKVTARIILRHLSCIEASMRIEHGGTRYAIEAVLPDKDSGREYMTILASYDIRGDR